jgi:hypothetical protein
MTENELIANIDSFLAGVKSPMAGFADYMVCLARRNGIGLTLSLGVAHAETNFATDPNMGPQDLSGHNAWGYGHPPGAMHGYLFASWPDGINSVTEHLANAYVYQGLTTVEEVCPKWVGQYSQSWVNAVSATIVQFGGSPEKLIRPPLAKEV